LDFDVLDDEDGVLELEDGVPEDGVLDVDDGFDMSLLLVEPPVADDELPFVMASNSARLSWPSLFLSALSKSMPETPLLAVPPEEAEPLLEPVLDPALADPGFAACVEGALGDFVWLSLVFLPVSAAYAEAAPKAMSDMPRTNALIFMIVSFNNG
jgi:hypothetical protein